VPSSAPSGQSSAMRGIDSVLRREDALNIPLYPDLIIDRSNEALIAHDYALPVLGPAYFMADHERS
jgi:hypothetical protein